MAQLLDASETRPLLVASIDFGTTYSGWAYSFYHDFKTDPTKAFVKQWHSGSGILSTEKTPTVVLVKPDGKTFDSFGYEAENRYRELVDEDQHRDYFYFKKFKMKLHTQLTEKIDRKFILHDEMGKSLPALDVFTMAIKYLVDDMHKVAAKRITGLIKTTDVHWVLTVPAIWTDQAKQFMREATEKAGIERSKLSIALEPEAASVYCRHLPVDKTVSTTGESISTLPPGTRYLIIDAGGGTIDVTVHEVHEKSGIKEVAAASGGGWGGILVDQAFEELLQDLFGKDVYETFKREETEDWLELVRDFEVKKRTVSPDIEGKIMMRLPASLSRKAEENGRNLHVYVRESVTYSGKIGFISDKIKFQSELFRKLFMSSCSKTTEHVTTLLKDKGLERLHIILMVGGYSESLMLQQAVIGAFPSMNVVIPAEASTAVLRGALICGHRPEFISERVLKYTYGLKAYMPFIAGKHPDWRRIKEHDGDYCLNAFDKHVEKGQIVKVGQAQTKRTYCPIGRGSTIMEHEVCASLLQNPDFADVGCTKIGSLTVYGAPDFTVAVSLTFSGTEIQVESVDIETGRKAQTTVNFLG